MSQLRLRRLNLLLVWLVVLTACAQPEPTLSPTATPKPTIVFPPTWTPTWTPVPIEVTSVSPIATPRPSVTLGPTATKGPPATPAASIAYTTTDQTFTIRIPSNWLADNVQRQIVSSPAQELSYVVFSAPGKAPQPAILIFYDWKASGEIDNDNAWQQAYALASLLFKVCPITLTTGASIEIGGETGKYIGYLDSCNVQGELIGLVHHGLNVGMLIEAPQPFWDQWRPILRDIVSSIRFEK